MLCCSDISASPLTRCAGRESNSFQVNCADLTKTTEYIPSIQLVLVYFHLHLLQ